MKLKAFSCFMFCLIISAPAFAEITRCINPFSSNTYKKDQSSLIMQGQYMWSQTIKLNDESSSWTTKITGVSMCSISSISLQVPKDATPAKYCWCRKITPRLGNWTYSKTSFTDTENCFSGCAEKCRASM